MAAGKTLIANQVLSVNHRNMASDFIPVTASSEPIIFSREKHGIEALDSDHKKSLLALVVIPVLFLCVIIAAGVWYYKKRTKKRLEYQRACNAAERARSQQAWHWLAEERRVQEDRARTLAMLEGRIPEHKTTLRTFGY